MTRNRKHKSSLIFLDEVDKVYHDSLIKLDFACRQGKSGETIDGLKVLRYYGKLHTK